jgi:hypothetical protein
MFTEYVIKGKGHSTLADCLHGLHEAPSSIPKQQKNFFLKKRIQFLKRQKNKEKYIVQ